MTKPLVLPIAMAALTLLPLLAPSAAAVPVCGPVAEVHVQPWEIYYVVVCVSPVQAAMWQETNATPGLQMDWTWYCDWEWTCFDVEPDTKNAGL